VLRILGTAHDDLDTLASFMSYWEPKLNVGTYCALALAAWVLR
jgi:hypothetical protein